MAHENFPGIQTVVHPLAVSVRRRRKDKVPLGRNDRVAKPLQFTTEPLPGLCYAAAAVGKIGLVPQGGAAGSLGKAVQVVVVADLVQGGNHLRPGNRQAEAHAGEGVALGQGAGHHDVLIFSHQIKGVDLGKIGVGFIHHQHAAAALRDPLDIARRKGKAEG